METWNARLVAQGCTQKFGLDYEETLSLVVRFESVRCLLALGARYKLRLHQMHMDVSTAFLHGELSEEVYMRQPEGFVKNGQENLVCHLKRRPKSVTLMLEHHTRQAVEVIRIQADC